jgi:hypothetical protein
VTGGHRNDITQLIPLVDAVPPIRGRRGRPRRRPRELFADRGYDHDVYRRQLRARGIIPRIARRGVAHGSGLGKKRWVVERGFAGCTPSSGCASAMSAAPTFTSACSSWPAPSSATDSTRRSEMNAMKTGASPRPTLAVREPADGMEGGPVLMLHVGLDLGRTRLDVHVMDEAGAPVLVTTATPDSGGLASLVHRVGEFDQPVTAAIESMTGARFIHDQLELRGWQVEIADAVKVKGLAPLAAKTDKIDAWVLAELSRRELVPAIPARCRTCSAAPGGSCSTA